MSEAPKPPAQPPATSAQGTALAVVIDDDSTVRQFISLILQGAGLDTLEFADGRAFRATRLQKPPALMFINVNLEVRDTIQLIESLSKLGFGGAVQLMSGRGSAVLDTVRQAGENFKLRILPVLKKPFETSAIQKIVTDLELGHKAPADIKIGLADALKSDTVEFWYQPKIDLRRKQLAGAEAFARVRHPEHGVLLPSNFMPGADDASVLTLAERALVSALKSGLNLSKLGVNLRIAINMPVSCLVKLRVGEIVREFRPQPEGWPGLIIDVVEEQIVSEITLANELNKKFAEHNVRLAIDDFGKGYASLTKLKELPFAEMKLDRSFVVGCGSDTVHAPVCKTVIDLAHSFGSIAVAVGLEKASDAAALVNMGCDMGQGFLFGQPMPEERFVALLKQRVTVRSAAAAQAQTQVQAQAQPSLQPA